MPDWSEDNRGWGLCCSGCCNPWVKRRMKGGPNSGDDGRPFLAYNVEGNPNARDCIILTFPPFIMFAPIAAPLLLYGISNSRLVISLIVNEKGVTEVVGELRTKSCCGEESETLKGIRGAEVEKTSWIIIRGNHQETKITYQLTILLAFGTRTIDCGQDGGERAAAEINEFISRFAPHVLSAPPQQIMWQLAPGPATAPAPASAASMPASERVPASVPSVAQYPNALPSDPLVRGHPPPAFYGQPQTGSYTRL